MSCNHLPNTLQLEHVSNVLNMIACHLAVSHKVVDIGGISMCTQDTNLF